MPTTTEFNVNLKKYANFKFEDPTTNYSITCNTKLGSGGFAKVFKVSRRSDNADIALKFI